jgi:hypothetical protein
MNDHRSPLRRIAALAVVALGMAGCAKQVTNPDSNYVLDSTYVSNPSHGGIEGRYSTQAQLIVHADAPLTLDSLADKVPVGIRGPEDSLVWTRTFEFAPGTLHGMIIDSTAASAYQVLRREGNGGFARLKDYVLNPVVRLLETRWEVYTFDDAHPSGFRPPTYVGRGVVAGGVTRSSPLTNAGELRVETVPALRYTGLPFPPDSNIAMSWDAVAGAAGYWVQIYQHGGGVVEAERQVAAQPAPLATRYVRNSFVGFMPPGVTSYQLGEPLPPGAKVLTMRPLINGREYFVRVAAVNGRGEMIAFTYGDYWFLGGITGYKRYRMGAARVQPGPQED